MEVLLFVSVFFFFWMEAQFRAANQSLELIYIFPEFQLDSWEIVDGKLRYGCRWHLKNTVDSGPFNSRAFPVGVESVSADLQLRPSFRTRKRGDSKLLNSEYGCVLVPPLRHVRLTCF